MDVHFVDLFFLIFAGAAVLGALALATRQPIIIAYIAIGAICGPSGLGYVADPAVVSGMAEIGIIFLLFLLGLDMQPASLWRLLRETSVVGIGSSLVFCGGGAAIAWATGATVLEACIIGAACMFSSTIIGIKLLPTTVLHHRHVGELVVSLLLLQDLIAILVLLAMAAIATEDASATAIALPFIALPLLVGAALLTVRWVILPLLARFDTFHEFIFLIAIGWCLAVAVGAEAVGLSWEMGGFVAGVSLASSPIAQYIAECLRPLRDFFLVLFFFSVGASFDLDMLGAVLLPALALTVVLLVLKPVTLRLLLGGMGEDRATAWEVGWRLGQLSEFSLMIAYIGAAQGLLGKQASHTLQLSAILTFVLSSYAVLFRYPSPISPIERLRRN
jgi:Kef-type K+ transport system membrane component KefB